MSFKLRSIVNFRFRWIACSFVFRYKRTNIDFCRLLFFGEDGTVQRAFTILSGLELKLFVISRFACFVSIHRVSKYFSFPDDITMNIWSISDWLIHHGTKKYSQALINNHYLLFFQFTGAQATLMSSACARRCHIERLIDHRWAGIAKGVGTQKSLVVFIWFRFKLKMIFCLHLSQSWKINRWTCY